MNTSKLSGLSVAVAAAALFIGAPAAQASEHGSSAMGHCVGANACKGQGACKSAANACKGKNACKGHGFTVTSEADCKAHGGKFEMSKADEHHDDHAKHES